MDELRKQMANDEVVSVKVEANEQIPKPKYYGLDALPAIQRKTMWIMEWIMM